MSLINPLNRPVGLIEGGLALVVIGLATLLSYALTVYLIAHDESAQFSRSQVKRLGLIALFVALIGLLAPYLGPSSGSIGLSTSPAIGTWPSFLLYCSFVAMLVVTGLVDAATRYIYDLVLLAFSLVHFTLKLILGGPVLGYLDVIKGMAMGAVIGGGIYLVIRLGAAWVFKKEAFGMGDVLLMAAIGLVMGPRDTLLVAVGAFYVALVLIGLIWLFKREVVKDYIPFGPFMCITAWLIYLWGNEIYGAYMGLILGS